MANSASLTGLLCRILLLSSVAYYDTNQVTVEFSTPRFIAPPSMFFCFTNTDIVITPDTITVSTITQGGTILAANETTVYSSRSTSFLSGSSTLDPIEVSRVYEVLATDPYYAGSYKRQRYDDLVRDQQGLSIQGVVDFPTDLNVATGSQGQNGNCFLLTAQWAANTRYQMTFSVTNPPPPASVEVPWPPSPPPLKPPPSPPRSNSTPPSPPSPHPPPAPPPSSPSFMQYTNNATPILWVLPVSNTINYYSNGSGSTAVYFQSLVFSVRGSKYGAACPLRSAIAPTMGAMFDACAESRKRGLGPSGNSTALVSDCLTRLRRVASYPGNAGTLPFTAPPLTSYNLSSFGVSSCGAGSSSSGTVRGPRFGGECVRCGPNGVVQNSTSCVCPPGILPNLVGDVACGEPITPGGNVTSLAALPAWLCSTFAAAKTSWQNKELLDHNVAKLYLDSFTQLAGPLLDQSVISNAYLEFNSTYIFDDRRPYSPTRTHGLKPNCDECVDGYFKDQYTKTQVPVFDWHFDAMNTFRFLGYVLDTELKSPCPALWDSSNPKEWGYGYYNQIICKPMPTDTCCGSNFDGNL